MNNGGVTDRIFGFAKKMVGHWSGGLAYVNVLSSLIFSGISGSALADVGGLGMIEIKAMRDEKYDDDPVSYTHLDVYKRQALHSQIQWKLWH